MDTNTLYEIKAEMFRIATGQMAPGKDPAPQSYSLPYEDRLKMWEVWLDEHKGILRAMELSLKRVIGTEDD